MKPLGTAQHVLAVQIFCGFSGQALLDGITTAFYNAFFTALPVGAFAIWDRPVKDHDVLVQHPATYRRVGRMNQRSFWKSGILQGIATGAVSRPSSDTVISMHSQHLRMAKRSYEMPAVLGAVKIIFSIEAAGDCALKCLECADRWSSSSRTMPQPPRA